MSHAHASRPRLAVAKAACAIAIASGLVRVALNPRIAGAADDSQLVVRRSPTASMPTPMLNFPGQGYAVSPGTIIGTPPDPDGAVGPNHYVQLVNRAYMI